MPLRRLLAFLLAAVLLAGPAGCGSDRSKGTYRGKDMPTPSAKK